MLAPFCQSRLWKPQVYLPGFDGADREAEGVALGDLLGHRDELVAAAGHARLAVGADQAGVLHHLHVQVEQVLRHVERQRVALALVDAALPRRGQVVLAAEALVGPTRRRPMASRMPSLAKCGTSTVWISARSGPSPAGTDDLELGVEVGPRDALLLDADARLLGELVDQLVHHLAVGAGEAVPVGDGGLAWARGAAARRARGRAAPPRPAAPASTARRVTPWVGCAPASAVMACSCQRFAALRIPCEPRRRALSASTGRVTRTEYTSRRRHFGTREEFHGAHRHRPARGGSARWTAASSASSSSTSAAASTAGIYDEGSPLRRRARLPHATCSRRRGRCAFPCLRWPGGNFVSGYHWLDGVGPKDERPRRSELAWYAEESNRFGTDEFIEYCRVLGTEPFICVNMGSGTMDEAQAWVEYCNGTGNTSWAQSPPPARPRRAVPRPLLGPRQRDVRQLADRQHERPRLREEGARLRRW